MKKIIRNQVVGGGILLLALTAVFFSVLLHVHAEEPVYTVVLDPGHGGADGGAVGTDGTLEKDLNLAISLLLREKLEARGIRVILTREIDDDTDGRSGFHKKEDLQARVTVGNTPQTDLYVSIHINASESSKDQGFQVWYGKNNLQGQTLAEEITKQVEEAQICTRIRVVKQVPDTLYIFRMLQVPNVLVECGFITNRADLYKLQQEEFRGKLCESICNGITEYLSQATFR